MSTVRRLPWPFFFLFVGAAIANLGLLSRAHPSPSLVLLVFLPALLFDAGLSLEPGAVRREWQWMLLFGLAGSLLAAAIAFLLLSALGFDRGVALILSAVLAATDPVAVFAVLRPLTVPRRLRLTLEGESLVNDGVAVVVTTLAIEIVAARPVSPAVLSLLFLHLTVVGLLVGGLIGLIGRPAVQRLPAPVSIVLTIVLAYGGYLSSDRLGGSGLIAVIATALVLATANPERGDALLHRFWRLTGSVAAAAVFLLMGLQAQAGALLSVAWRLAGLILVTLLARAIMVLLLTRVAPRLWPWAWRAALTWAGLRGALSLALALSVPLGVHGRDELAALVFGFILISLATQGISLGPVFSRLGIVEATTAPS